MNPLGHTRTVVRRTHALIAPDSHVLAALPGWENARGVTLISRAMGASFAQYLVHFEATSGFTTGADGMERFVYVLEGEIEIESRRLAAGGYAYFPAEHPARVRGASSGKAILFEKKFQRIGSLSPRLIIGTESEVAASPFMGDPDAQLKLLLPDEPAFDMAVNIFAYNPGAMLPQVECHVMEHGLMMLSGMGVYRLDDRWYPVQAGDVIWMAPYCPQWFIAGGKTPARYIYYKDVNRSAL
jgi:(S)-ureidoglycine aminohydrolase